jgi:hypothetical protein
MAAMSSSTKSLEQAKTGTSNRAASSSRALFFTASALIYIVAIGLATLTLNPYFSQTWDVSTFIHAGLRFLDGGLPFDLYAQSRAAQNWPYAYPPLHALVVAMALFLGSLVRGLPDFLWARAPVMLADLGVAFMLYHIVEKESADELIARLAALLWLFNPVTFYDTAVQGHFESEWLLFILIAYVILNSSRNVTAASIALAVAFLFKQTAIMFAMPMWMFLLTNVKGGNSPFQKRIANLLLSLAIFGIVVGAVCLPFLLYSDDFAFMNLTYVENVPVQTQSWIVGLLGLTRASPNAMTSDFILLRYQTIVTLLATAAITLLAARRGWNLYLTATLIALAFFLTSKKVMGYYYVMLFPFLLAYILPRRRFNLALITVVATTWIALSPYYAAWGDPAHWWIYAVLGTLNSVLFAGMAIWLARHSKTDDHGTPGVVEGNPRLTLFVTLGLFACAFFAALLQPFATNSASPIRAPIIAPGMELNALSAFGALLILVSLSLAMIKRLTHDVVGRVPGYAWGIVLLFAPLFFSVYYLTKESTAIFEIALKALGV